MRGSQERQRLILHLSNEKYGVFSCVCVHRFELFRKKKKTHTNKQNRILLLERTTNYGLQSLPFWWTCEMSASLSVWAWLECSCWNVMGPAASTVGGDMALAGTVQGFSITMCRDKATVSSNREANLPSFPSPHLLTLISPVTLHLCLS